MATAQQTLTPITNQTPALVSIADVALSGAHWVKRFPGSAATSDLARPFRDGVDAFLGRCAPPARWSLLPRPLDRRSAPT